MDFQKSPYLVPLFKQSLVSNLLLEGSCGPESFQGCKLYTSSTPSVGKPFRCLSETEIDFLSTQIETLFIHLTAVVYLAFIVYHSEKP